MTKTIDKIRKERFEAIKVRFAKQFDIPSSKGLVDEKIHVVVCCDTGCRVSGGDTIRLKLEDAVKRYNLEEKVGIYQGGCFGLCSTGPNIIVYPQGIFYTLINEKDIEELVGRHFREGNIVKRLVYKELVQPDQVIKPVTEAKFYRKQVKIALKNVGVIDPENLDDYLAVDGYQALKKCLFELKPQEVINILKESNLRGRGGAGFPTGIKWQTAHDQTSDKKYVCCNADEGDPGAFMDRSILEGDPHSVIEAMIICGYAIGADEGFIYVRAEYPNAIKRLNLAIKQAEEMNLLGDNILGSNFNFKLTLRLGAGAFVCGEETALIASIEGKRGIPITKPPFPAVSGIYGKPTIINNVETYANVTRILLNGPDWFKSIGTEKSPGTKVFSLGGKIVNSGLIEVPMGTTIREIVYEIGGGIPNNKAFKAVQTGGPSGGCIPKEFLDVPIDYDNLAKLGSIMGSGGFIVLDEDNCMVDIAKFYLSFTVDESCGKCTPCRIGNKRLYEMLDDITSGRVDNIKFLDKMHELAVTIIETSACGLGQTAPNPVISTLQYFSEEYLEHIVNKKCHSGVCQALVDYTINDKCIGCTRCQRVCPMQCITGILRSPHVIDQSVCIKCGSCYFECPVGAIDRG